MLEHSVWSRYDSGSEEALEDTTIKAIDGGSWSADIGNYNF